MQKDMVCVACPLGCNLTVELEGEKIISVKGNTCKRGDAYARSEVTNPTRSLTSTVKVRNGRYPVIPVKSASPLPKSMLIDCARELCKVDVKAPIKIGDVIVHDILGTGVDIIATNCTEKK
ncbi:MAG: DUF1667 domain-containing protein [Clostridiales bacterium]|jgi:CxxC motif-containing protein|nr:DUF1667 domain-containing protein [Clostridiales bacterium]